MRADEVCDEGIYSLITSPEKDCMIAFLPDLFGLRQRIVNQIRKPLKSAEKVIANILPATAQRL
jgi:hypothetical protein